MAVTLRAFGSVSTMDCAWTVVDVRRAIRSELKLKGAVNVTLGGRAGVAAHVDGDGDLLVVHVARVA